MAQWLLDHVPFIKYGFCLNYWVWFHILAGALAGRLLRRMEDYWKAVSLIAVGAILWEGIELAIDGISAYSSWVRWLYDSLGDVVGSVVAALFAL